MLASNAPDEERLKALKYVVHFVADVHQPLHAGFADDRGGNKYQLQAFGRGTNLHAVWDVGLVEHWPGGARALRAAVGAEKSTVDASFAPGKWAEESCRVVSTDGFYPTGHKLRRRVRSAVGFDGRCAHGCRGAAAGRCAQREPGEVGRSEPYSAGRNRSGIGVTPT